MRQSDNPNRPIPDVSEKTHREGTSARRVAINTISNWVALGAQVGTAMFLLTYIFRYFDEEHFGIYRLAVSLSAAVSFFSFGMSASVLRLASESLAAKAWDRLSDVLSVSRTLLVLVAVVGLAVVVAISFVGLDLLKVPKDDQPGAALLIQMTGLAAALELVFAVYGGALRARQRYDLANTVLVGQVVLQAVFIVVCFEVGWVSLEVLGLGRLLMTALAMVVYVVMTRRILPQVRLSFRRFKRSVVWGVVSFSVWTGIKNATRITLEQIGVPIVSATLGVAAVAAIAVPQMLSQYLLQMAGGLTATLWPIAAQYAFQGRRESLARLYRIGTRLVMMMMVPAMAVLVTHGRPLIWALKPELVWTYNLALLYVGLFLARGAMLAGDHIILASGSIRSVVISQVLAVVAAVPLALGVAVWTKWGLYGVVVALFVPFAIQSLVYLPYRIRVETGVGYGETFLGCMAGPVAGGAVPLAVGWVLAWVWPPSSLWLVLLQSALCVAVYWAVAWFWIFSREEQDLVRRVFRRSPAAEAAEGVPGSGL